MKYFFSFLLAGWLIFGATHVVVHAATTTTQIAESESSDDGSTGFGSDDQPITNSVVTPPVTAPADSTPTDNTNTTVDSTNTSSTPATSATDSATMSIAPVTPAPTSTTQTTTTVASTTFPWPWILSRGTGVASFILLGLLSATGILLTTGSLFRLLSPAASWSLHRAIGTALLVSVLVHIFSLLFDTFIKLHLVDLLVPFASHYQPLLVGLGTVGFYILLLVLATSLYTLTSHAKFWRSVHFFAFPMYLLVFLHSSLLGTDTKEWWMQIVYWGSAAIIGGAVAYRLAWKYRTAPAAQG